MKTDIAKGLQKLVDYVITWAPNCNWWQSGINWHSVKAGIEVAYPVRKDRQI